MYTIHIYKYHNQIAIQVTFIISIAFMTFITFITFMTFMMSLQKTTSRRNSIAVVEADGKSHIDCNAKKGDARQDQSL